MTPSPRRAIRSDKPKKRIATREGKLVRFLRNLSSVGRDYQQVWFKQYPTPQIAGKAKVAWESDDPRVL